MHIKSIVIESINEIEKVKKIYPPKNEIEEAAIRWKLYAILQNALDCTAMIISELGLRKPKTYSEMGVVLKEKGLIDNEIENYFKIIASTRNILAHAYRKLSVEDLGKIIHEILPITYKVFEKIPEICNRQNVDPKVINFEKLKNVFQKHEVVLAYLFGSRAKGIHRPDSDFDIAVLFKKDQVTIIDEIKLALDISKVLNIPIEQIDVISLNNTDPLLTLRILNEGVVIYEESPEFRKFWERKILLNALIETDLYAAYTSRILKKLKKSKVNE